MKGNYSKILRMKKILNDIATLKREMELISIADTRAAATRAGIKWIQEGGKK